MTGPDVMQSRIKEADEVIRVEVEEGASDWQQAPDKVEEAD